jgi:neutral ceramidase
MISFRSALNRPPSRDNSPWIWLALVVGFCGFADGILVGQEFRAAVVKVDVTPDTPQMLLGYRARKSTGVLHRIHHRILALDDGKTQFFIVSSEFCVKSPALYDQVMRTLRTEQGIDPVNVWWTLTHTHSAPELGPPGLPAAFMKERYQHQPDMAYATLVERALIDGIARARANLKPARLGVGWGFSQANINRRARELDGSTSLGMNPDGPVDRRIGLLRIDAEDGAPLALVANYAIHGTVLGGAHLQISGDVQGVVSEYVESVIGAPMLFVNGAAGNLAPIYSVYPDAKAGHLNQFKVLLGEKIVDGYRAIKNTRKSPKLQSGAIIVHTPMKAGLQWPAELADYAQTAPDSEPVVKLPVRFLRIDHDLAIWAAPLELFCEISNEIRDRSPFAHTFFFGYTNGWLGYLLTDVELGYGGYEATVSPFTASAAKDLTNAVLGHLQGPLRSQTGP